jgi:hypothetical protein
MTNTIEVVQALVDALERVTTSETFFRDPRGDRAGPAIDAGRALLSQLQSQESTAPSGEKLPAWQDVLGDAEQVVRQKPIFAKYIKGTILENDVPVWMATFAQQAVMRDRAKRAASPSQENTAGSAAPQDGYPEGFDASCGLSAHAMRTANGLMCGVTGKREWDVPMVAAALESFAALSASPPAAREGVREQPVAHLRPITHPDWLEVCHQDETGAFPVFAHGVRESDEAVRRIEQAATKCTHADYCECPTDGVQERVTSPSGIGNGGVER